eukprot:753168-Hanusia_phi.AAC.2
MEGDLFAIPATAADPDFSPSLSELDALDFSRSSEAAASEAAAEPVGADEGAGASEAGAGAGS